MNAQNNSPIESLEVQCDRLADLIAKLRKECQQDIQDAERKIQQLEYRIEDLEREVKR